MTQPNTEAGDIETWYCGRIKACGWKGGQSETVLVRNPERSPLVSYTHTCPDCGHGSFFMLKPGEKVPKGWKPKADRIAKLKAELARLEPAQLKGGAK